MELAGIRLRAAGLNALGRNELARTLAERKAIEFGLNTGELVAIG